MAWIELPLYLPLPQWFLIFHLFPLYLYYRILVYSYNNSKKNQFVKWFSPVYFLYILISPYYFHCNHLFDLMVSGASCGFIMKLVYSLYLNESPQLNPLINNSLLNQYENNSNIISFGRFVMYLSTTQGSVTQRRYTQALRASKSKENSDQAALLAKYHRWQPSLLLSPRYSAFLRVQEVVACWVVFQFTLNLYIYLSDRPELMENAAVLYYFYYYLLGLNFYLFIGMSGGLVFAVFECLYGVNLHSMMFSPWFSSSPREFWSQRWNKLFRDMFHDLCYSKLFKNYMNSTASALLAFVFSAFLHELGIILAFGAENANFDNFYFFFLHGIVTILQVILENHWPAVSKRVPWAVKVLINGLFFAYSAQFFFGPYERVGAMHLCRVLLLYDMGKH
jgi:hypothetical protein